MASNPLNVSAVLASTNSSLNPVSPGANSLNVDSASLIRRGFYVNLFLRANNKQAILQYSPMELFFRMEDIYNVRHVL